MKLFSKFSVKRPVSIIMGVLIVIVLGIISLLNLTTELLPDVNFPYAIISTNYIGASPELIENTITKPIESSMATVSNIKNISSVSNENYSIVVLEFYEKVDIDAAVVEIREKLDMLKGKMPENASQSNIIKLKPDMIPVMQFSISFKDLDMNETSRIIKSKILSKLESIEGVADITVTGIMEDVIEIKLNHDKIDNINKKYRTYFASKGLPYQDIAINDNMIKAIIGGQNFEMPVGYVDENGNKTLVRIGNSINSIEELKALPIISNQLMEVKIDDVTDVSIINNEDNTYSKVNGEDAVIISLQKQNNYATSDVVKNINKRLDSLKNEYKDMQISILFDQSKYINMTINAVLKNLMYGAILAIIVLILFLKDIKPTVIIGLAIPISVIATFIMVYFYGITLNIISLGGLALGIGMLVDNAIVVIENIFRLRNEGVNIKDAAIEGASQVASAITASTLTTVAVFVPIIFLEGMTAEIFKQMALTVSFSLLASLVIALTLVPMLASNMFYHKNLENLKFLNKIIKIYDKSLKVALKYKYLTVIITIIIFIGSIFGLSRMGTEYIPSDSTEDIIIEIEMPSNATFVDTKEALDQLMNTVSEIDGVETTAITLSNNDFDLMGMNNYIYVIKDEKSKRSRNDISNEILEKTKDFDFKVYLKSEIEMTNIYASGIQVDIMGEDLEVLNAISDDFVEIISKIEGTDRVSSNIKKNLPEIKIVVDRHKSISKGITNYNVFATLNSLLNVNNKATTINIENRQYDVNVLPSQVDIITEKDIKNIKIDGIPINEIATIEKGEGATSINRNNQNRYISITANIKDDYNIGLIGRKIEEEIKNYDVPNGYEIILAGENAEINNSIRELVKALLLSILLIYMVMAIQFESLIYPFIIMFAVPLAFTGSFIALSITNTPLSVVALIGMIILAGIVVNNGIVLVDYINQLKEKGKSLNEAIIEAGKVRMRPILMTSLTTILALMTLALGIGEGAKIMQPMAITTIGGLFFATVLTLLVVPCIYMIFDNIKDKVRRRN